MDEELSKLLETLTGGALPSSIKLCAKSLTGGDSLADTVEQHVYGLLNQDVLTKEQLELFSLLLRAWELFKGRA